MSRPPYSYHRKLNTRYTFVSVGKSNIDKVVDFTPTAFEYLYNLGFGDLLPDGRVDDSIKSNNGDIVKVLATVVQILKEFTKEYPHIKVVFTGSTIERTILYRRILNTYYTAFTKEFIITALVSDDKNFYEVPFTPQDKYEYVAFFISRIT